jgi:hypothetical protein
MLKISGQKSEGKQDIGIIYSRTFIYYEGKTQQTSSEENNQSIS